MSRRGPERKIEDEFVVAMDFLGWLSRKGDIAAEQVAGESDRFMYGPGARTVIVEFKRLGAPRKRRGEKLQRHIQEQFRKLGFETYVVIGRGDAAGVFKTITGEDYDEVLKRARLVRAGREHAHGRVGRLGIHATRRARRKRVPA